MTRIKLPLSLGYSVLAGPVIWFVHFIIVYAVNEFGCRTNFSNQLFLTSTTMQLVVVIATIAGLVLVGFGGALAYRQWRSLENRQGTPSSSELQINFLAMMGILLSLMFLFAILMTAAPAVFLPTCDQAT